jgi:4-carboxymuconolactone decarboxylase
METKIGRYVPSPQQNLPAERAGILQLIVRQHGRVPLPLEIWSCNPDLARVMESVASYLVPHSSLNPRETEMAILVSAAHWDCAYVWDGHVRAARELGLADDTIRAIKAHGNPIFATERESCIYRAAVELQTQRKLPLSSFESLVALIGHTGIADLSALLGFYNAVAFILISYDVPGRP